MSEFEREDAAADISTAVYDWLEAEIHTSSAERNSYLDDYNKAIRGLRGGWNHPDNFTARKLEAHLDRLPVWFEGFSYNPEDDSQAAKLIFAGLMQVSGSYRNQCYVEARGAEDYRARRQKVIGINIQNTIRRRLRELLPSAAADFTDSSVSVESLGAAVTAISKESMTEVSAVSNRLKQGYDLGNEGSVSARKMQEAQALWLDFTTDCVSLAAKIRRGDLRAVPFLEPRSISDQSGKVYYPLSEPVDWPAVLA